MLLDFGVHTLVFFYVRRQRLRACLCIAGKQLTCGLLLIVNALMLRSRVPKEGPSSRTLVKSFGRFLRMTGQTHASGRVRCDLLLQFCNTKYLEKQVKHIVREFATFTDVLVALERLYPSYETNQSIQTEIQNMAMLPNNPKAARISEQLAHWDHLVGQLTPGSDGSDKLQFWVVAKIPRDM